MRGDNSPLRSIVCGMLGPPPHAWGQPLAPRAPAGLRRSTPTCVGTTTATPAPTSISTVHPHMRGDNGLLPGGMRLDLGPPPHAWGQHCVGAGFQRPARSTPTCVGTTSPL